MATEFTTPPGRIVWGNPAKATIKKDNKTKQPVLRDGKQVEQWAFGLAIPKADFNAHVWPFLAQEAATIFPHGVPQNFSWKFKDGDGVDSDGKPFNQREGYAGHFVLTISTEAFAPQIFKNEGGRYRQIDPSEIKCGDYVVVRINAKANQPADRTHTPGVYINPVGIELIGYGQEIVTSGANPDEMFGGKTYALPPGASATPQAPAGGTLPPYATAPYQAPQATGPSVPPQAAPYGVAPGQPQAYNAPGAPVSAPQYAPPQQAPGQPLPPPAHDFVRNAGQPPQAAPMGNAAPQGIPAAPVGHYAQPTAYPSNPPQQYAPPGMPGIPQGR